ncbi:MAG: hypothetical protein ABSD76_15325 [Terriglobales bacterium]
MPFRFLQRSVARRREPRSSHLWSSLLRAAQLRLAFPAEALVRAEPALAYIYVHSRSEALCPAIKGTEGTATNMPPLAA